MNFQPLVDLVPDDIRAMLGTQSLRLGRPVHGRRWGHHAASRPGPGLDFRDHRPYAPGDDLRRLDWKAVARRDRLVLRQTESEDELPLALLVDGGAGMSYGQGGARKFSAASALAASLAWVATAQGDPVAFAIGGASIGTEASLRPRRTTDALELLAKLLKEHHPAGITPWSEVIAHASRILPPRSLVIVFSDFLDPGGEGLSSDDEALLSGLQSLRNRQHEVALVQVLHRDELEFPWKDSRALRFLDLWKRRAPVEAGAVALRETYLQSIHTFLEAWDNQVLHRGMLLERIVSDEPLAQPFVRLLRRIAGQRSAVR